MPLYYFVCDTCKAQLRKILTPTEAKLPRACTCEKGQMIRDPRPPTTQSVEVLDNGAMAKSVERLTDAEQLFAERNAAVKKQQFGE